MSLGLELAKQRAALVSYEDRLKESTPSEIPYIKDEMRLTKQKIKKLENKIKSQSRTY